MDFAVLHSIWTVVLLVGFLGVVVWAYDSRRKGAYDAAARSVLDDDEDERAGGLRGD